MTITKRKFCFSGKGWKITSIERSDFTFHRVVEVLAGPVFVNASPSSFGWPQPTNS
ncbi:hypothetical protein [Pseudomonas sp. TMB3-21]